VYEKDVNASLKQSNKKLSVTLPLRITIANLAVLLRSIFMEAIILHIRRFFDSNIATQRPGGIL